MIGTPDYDIEYNEWLVLFQFQIYFSFTLHKIIYFRVTYAFLIGYNTNFNGDDADEDLD